MTKKAWIVTKVTNHRTALSEYQDERDPKICKIVNTVTKVKLTDGNEPILIGLNYATLVEDPNEH